MRVAWATDIHLNFIGKRGRENFFRSAISQRPDAVFITGDIAEAPTLDFHLEEMSQFFRCPVYFVLGNHDFYFGSIERVRKALKDSKYAKGGLWYLPDLPGTGYCELTARTALVGVDGWGDGRYGNYWQSPVRLNDQECIDDFRRLDREAVLRKLFYLGDEAAESLRQKLAKVGPFYPHIMVLTHVPPFKEACWYQGRMGNDDWLPYFTCQAVGEVLVEAAQSYPACRMTVLCGHTHHAGAVRILPNLYVKTGSAEYGQPHWEEILTIE